MPLQASLRRRLLVRRNEVLEGIQRIDRAMRIDDRFLIGDEGLAQVERLIDDPAPKAAPFSRKYPSQPGCRLSSICSLALSSASIC